MRSATGARYERATRDILKAEGYQVIRSAGSLGAADLMAMKPGQTLLLQCKRCAANDPPMSRIIGGDEWNALYQQAMAAGAIPVLAAWVGKASTQLQLIRLTGLHSARLQHWPSAPFILDEVAACH